MLRFIVASALLLIAACEPPPPAATLTEIPSAFHGRWDFSAGDCKSGSEHAVEVGASEVLLPDSRLDVKGVAPDGKTALRADGHFQSSIAEWDGSVRLELAEGGAVLNAVTGSTVVPRVKCP